MAENIGLGIDLVFNEEKVNQNLKILLDRLSKGDTSSLVLNIDTKDLVDTMTKVEDLNKMKLTFDENGDALKEVQTYNKALGETITISRDLATGKQTETLSVDTMIKQKAVFTELKSIQDSMAKNNVAMIKLEGEQFEELNKQNKSLKERFQIKQQELKDTQLITKLKAEETKHQENYTRAMLKAQQSLENTAKKEAQSKLDRENLQLQKDLYSDLSKIQNEQFSLKTKLLSSEGVYTEELSKQSIELKKQFDLKQQQISISPLGNDIRLDNQLMSERNKLENDYSIAVSKNNQLINQKNEKERQAREKESQDIQKLIKLTQQQYEIKLKNLSNSKNSEFVDTARLEQLKVKIEQLNGTTLKGVREQIKQLDVELKNITADSATKRIANLGTQTRSLGDAFKTMGIYVSSAMVVRQLWSELRDGVGYVKELNSAFTDLSITMDITTKQFGELVSRSNNIAKANGIATSSVLQMAKTYANANTSIDEVMNKLEATIALTNIAGMNASESTSAVQSTLNQFQLLADGTMDVAEATEYMGNILVSVSQNMAYDFQSGTKELVSGIQEAGSAMQSAGMDLESYAGIMGKLIEITGSSGSEVANSLKMIGARTLQIKSLSDEMGVSADEMANAERALSKFDISIRDGGGALRNLQDILFDLSKSWKTMTDEEKQSTAEAVAGNRQRAYLIALMNSMDGAMELTNKAYESQGVLMEANGKYTESITGKLGTLKAQSEQFYATVISSDGFAIMLDSVTGLLGGTTMFMDFFGGMPALIATVVSAFVAYNTVLKANEVGAKNAHLSNMLFSNGIKLVDISAKMATIAVASMNAVLTFGLSLAVTAVIGKFVEWCSGLKSTEERINSTREKVDSLTDSLNGIDNINSNIGRFKELSEILKNQSLSTEDRLKYEKEISDVKGKLISEEPKYKTILEDQTGEYEKQVELMKTIQDMKLREQAQDVANDVVSDGDAKGLKKKVEEDIRIIEDAENKKIELYEKANQRKRESYEELINIGLSEEDALNGAQKAYDEVMVEIEQLNLRINESSNAIVNNKIALDERNSQLEVAIENGAKTNKTVIELDESTKSYTDSLISQKSAIEDVVEVSSRMGEFAGKSSEQIAEENRKANESYVELSKSLVDIQALIDDINKNGINIDSAGDVLDMFEDFSGNINNSAEVLDFLNSKLDETKNLAEDAYRQMSYSSESYFNDNVRDTEDWANFQRDVYQQLMNLHTIMRSQNGKENDNYFQNLANNLQNDLSNCKSVAEAEVLVEKAKWEAMDKMSVEYFNNVTRNMNQMNDTLMKAQERGVYAPMASYSFDEWNAFAQYADFAKVADGYIAKIKALGSVKLPPILGGSSSGSSSSGATEKQIEDLKGIANALYDIENAITDLDNALKKNQILQKNATPTERIKLMEEELYILREQAKAYQQLEVEQKKQAKIMQDVLKGQGFKFDDKGDITNYQKRVQELQDWTNSLNGDSKKEAIDFVKDLMDTLEDYTKLVNQDLPKTEQTYLEYINTIKEAERERAEYVTDLQKKVSDAIKQQLEKETEIRKKELQKQKDLLNDQWKENDYQDKLTAEQRKLDEIQQQINNLSRDSSMAGQLKLQQLMAEYEAQKQAIDEMIKDQERDNANDRFDEALQEADDKLEEMLDPENLAQLVNQALTSGFVELDGQIYETENLLSQMLENSGEAFTALGSILRSELIEQLQTVQGLMGSIGSLQLSSYDMFGNNSSQRNLQSRIAQPMSVVFDAPLMEVNGSITEDVLPRVQAMISSVKDSIVYDISRALQTT